MVSIRYKRSKVGFDEQGLTTGKEGSTSVYEHESKLSGEDYHSARIRVNIRYKRIKASLHE